MDEAQKEKAGIILRRMDYNRASDAQALASLVKENREHFERFEGILPEMYTSAKNVAEMFSTRGAPQHWGIQVGMEVVGFVSILPHFDDSSVWLGYSLAKAYTERGITTKAVRLVLESLPGKTKTVFARVDPENTASIRVLEKLGFERFGSSSSPSGSQELLFRLERTAK